jgi:predicted house-cleaning NTP pyrophosphatase (Maf/HAM1 superfamily)
VLHLKLHVSSAFNANSVYHTLGDGARTAPQTRPEKNNIGLCVAEAEGTPHTIGTHIRGKSISIQLLSRKERGDHLARGAPAPPRPAYRITYREPTPRSNVQVVVSSFEETLPKADYEPAGYAEATARHKALDVAGLLGPRGYDLVIGADTVVEAQGQVLEKPLDAEDAFKMLSILSGGTHFVHTGVALVVPGQPEEAVQVRSFSVTTEVVFDELNLETIQAYIASGGSRVPCFTYIGL